MQPLKMAAIAQGMSLKFFPGEKTGDCALEFLLISSSQHYLDEMQKHLYVTRKVQPDKRPYNLNVHICKNIKDVLSLKPDDFTVDFIVFIVDVKNNNCLLEVQDNLNLLDSSFSREKICIVNPNPSYEKSTVKPLDLWDFAQHYQINLINGKINDQEKVANLSKRILNLAEACCGVVNGIPLIGYV